VRARSIRVAHQYFDLKTVGGLRYVNVYRRLEGQAVEVEADLKISL
jgi:hypothetical protein